MSETRRSVEDAYKDAGVKATDAELAYRKAYSQAYAKRRIAGEGDGAADRYARGEAAALAHERDGAAATVKFLSERLKGLEGDRSLLKSLIDWSSRMDDRPPPEPSYRPRAAA